MHQHPSQCLTMDLPFCMVYDSNRKKTLMNIFNFLDSVVAGLCLMEAWFPGVWILSFRPVIILYICHFTISQHNTFHNINDPAENWAFNISQNISWMMYFRVSSHGEARNLKRKDASSCDWLCATKSPGGGIKQVRYEGIAIVRTCWGSGRPYALSQHEAATSGIGGAVWADDRSGRGICSRSSARTWVSAEVTWNRWETSKMNANLSGGQVEGKYCSTG